MKRRDAVKFLHILRTGEIVESSDGWLRTSCPLALFTHHSGRDEHPSFGIKLNDTGESGYHCFVCGSGSLRHLLHRMVWTVGVPDEAFDLFSSREIFVERAERGDLSYPEIFEFSDLPAVSIPVPFEVLSNYPLLKYGQDYEAARVRDWFLGRRISLRSVLKYGIRYAPKERVVIFPVKDTDNNVYGLHVRSRVRKSFYYLTPELAGFPNLKWGRRDFWFGIQFLDFTKPVLIVESETDLLRLDTLGVSNVVASCGPLNKRKLDRIAVKERIFGFDSDAAGRQYLSRCVQFVPHEELIALDWSIVGAKDAGDLRGREDFDVVYAARKRLKKWAFRGRAVSYPEKFSCEGG